MDYLKKNITQKIAVFGPHDRMNYGDFLFPLMLEYAFSKELETDITLKKYSLVKSDFRSYGAFKSKNYLTLRKDINADKINLVIVAGGECLSANWSNLYSYINSIYHYFIKKEFFRKNRYLRNIPKYLYRGYSDNPFIIDPTKYDNKVKVIYNAVGGGNYLNEKQLSTINKSTICGLREIVSFSHVQKKVKNAILVPDSAIIISDVFTNFCNKKITNRSYIFFQLSNYKYQNRMKDICKQLSDILNNTNLDIILCPVGTAKGHEDHIILQKIEMELNNDRVIFYSNQPKLNEIAQLIANATIYIGTSLHGIITSMSYGVPYIALNPDQEKVVAYLETWSIDELKKVSNTCEFYADFKKLGSLENLSKEILQKTKTQKQQYYSFVSLMIKSFK